MKSSERRKVRRTKAPARWESLGGVALDSRREDQHRLVQKRTVLFVDDPEASERPALRFKLNFRKQKLVSLETHARGSHPDGAINGHRFVRVAGGRLQLGGPGRTFDPPRRAFVRSFAIATRPTTNAQFARFVRATGYVTSAERRGWGIVLKPVDGGVTRVQVKGASWILPGGLKDRSVRDAPHEAVCQISLEDAEAYCRWAGLRLPAADEWAAMALSPWGRALKSGSSEVLELSGERGYYRFGPEVTILARRWLESEDARVLTLRPDESVKNVGFRAVRD